MRAFKDIIRSKYIELDDIKTVISDDVFRQYVGISLNTFENKLFKIDNAIDQFAFKIQKPVEINYSIKQQDYKSNYSQQVNILSNTNTCPKPQITSCKKISIEELYTSFSFQFFPDLFSIQENHKDFAEFVIEVEPQKDSLFIRTLKETYGDDWEIVYEHLIGFKQVFSILLSIEQLLFNEQNEQYHNSCSRLFKYEYYDLMSTLKKMGNYFQFPVVNHLFYSSVTSINNEKEAFN